MKKQNSTTFPTYHNNNTNNSNTQQDQQYTQNHYSSNNNITYTNTNTSKYNNQRQQQQRNHCQIIPSEQFLPQTQPPTQYRQQPTLNNFNYQQQQRQQQQHNISTTMSSLITSNFQTNQFNSFSNQQQQQQYATYQSHQQQQQQLPNLTNFQNVNLLQQQQSQIQNQLQLQRRQQLQLPLFNQNNLNPQQSQQSQQLQQRQELFEQAQQQLELNVAVTSNAIAAVSNNLDNCSSSLAITSNGINGGQNSNEIDKFSMDANEIANFIAHELLMQQLVSVDGIQSGVPTQTTATLTPTTLRTIEETFMELIEEPITHLAQAGFIPPSFPSTSNNTTNSIGGSFNGSVPTEFNDTESDDSRNSLGPHVYEDYQLGGDTTENSSATTDSTSFQMGLKNSLATSNSNSTSTNDFGALVAATTSATGKKNNANTSSSATTVTPPPTRRNQGGRRPAKSSNLSPEEEEKRRLRRERNKLAAARCRKRRVDLTNQLLGEVAQLEKRREDLQKDIETLNKEKKELEYILDAHNPTCQKIRQDLLSVSTYGGLIAPTTSSNTTTNNINITGIDTTLASTGCSSPIDLKPVILNDSLLGVPHIKDEPLDVALDSNSLDNDDDDDGPSSTKRMLLSNNNPMIPPPLPKISTLSPSLAAAASLNTPIVTTAPINFGSFGSIQNNAMVVNTLNALNKPLLNISKQRPTTLPTMPRNTALGLNVDNKPPTDINGVAIQTPSTGTFNFESLMDGGTGLTPVSGPLVPTCSSQNKHPLELTTPTSEPSKLVSL